MNDLDVLLAIEQIKQLKARYFRSMDTKDWGSLEAVFAGDAVMDMRSEMRDGRKEGGLTQGAAAIVAFMRASIETVTTVHHGHAPEIEILGPDHARGIWAMEDVLRWPDDSPAPIRNLRGYGHYHETYQKIDGQWRIKTTRLTRLRVDVG